MAYSSSSATPPPPPPQTTVQILDNFRELRFSDGFVYQFRNADHLSTATLVRTGNKEIDEIYKHNQQLAHLGDATAKYILMRSKVYQGHAMRNWIKYHDRGVACNAYLADQADATGLTGQLIWCDAQLRPHREMIEHEKGDALEAILGAVEQDTNGDIRKVEEVMVRFGIWWPKSEEAEWRFTAMMDSWKESRGRW